MNYIFSRYCICDSFVIFKFFWELVILLLLHFDSCILLRNILKETGYWVKY